MTAPDFDARIHFASRPDFGRVVKMIRADAPELVALVEAAKFVRGAAQEAFRTADFHRGECSCPRCAEDALLAALAAYEALQ